MYGYAAEKTGDHKAAMLIFEDCIERWSDVYSMIWLAQMYDAGYASLARFHYGVARYEGVGTEANKPEAIRYLRQASQEGT